MNPKQRHFARRMIMQALYEKEVSDNDNQVIIAGFLIENSNFKFDKSYFQTGFIEITQNLSQIDELYSKYIDRKDEALDLVSKCILRLGAYELKYKLDVPYRVVINESVNLAKTFAGDDSYKFVNATLDKVAKEIRQAEKQ